MSVSLAATAAAVASRTIAEAPGKLTVTLLTELGRHGAGSVEGVEQEGATVPVEAHPDTDDRPQELDVLDQPDQSLRSVIAAVQLDGFGADGKGRFAADGATQGHAERDGLATHRQDRPHRRPRSCP